MASRVARPSSCQDGQVVKWQASNSTWVCGSGGSGATTSTALTDFDSSAPTSDGKVPIWDNTQSKYIPGDPLVQGVADNASTTTVKPVIGGGYDTAGTPAIRRFTLGNSTPAGTEYGLIVRPIPSGTQAVSGTFWQSTQPVSIASMPSTPVTGTFWQATQPVSGTFWQATQPVSGTVTANAGSGTFNIQSNASVNQTQVNGVAVSVGMGSSDTGTQRLVLAQEATYSAGTTAKTATAAGTGPFFSICGSATKTVRIQRISISGTVATAAVYGDIVIKKTSTATSAGTATTLTQAPFDSSSAAGTATNVKYYTALGTAGTSVGVILTATQFFPLTGTVALTPPPFIYTWRDVDAESPTLRGTAQCMEANFGTTTTNAPTLSVSVAWTEK